MPTSPDPPEPPTVGERAAEWCGRDRCPACQGYEFGPEGASDCPWLDEPLPNLCPDCDQDTIRELPGGEIRCSSCGFNTQGSGPIREFHEGK